MKVSPSKTEYVCKREGLEWSGEVTGRRDNEGGGLSVIAFSNNSLLE